MAKAKPKTATIEESLRATLEFPLADPLPASYIARETGDLKARLDRGRDPRLPPLSRGTAA